MRGLTLTGCKNGSGCDEWPSSAAQQRHCEGNDLVTTFHHCSEGQSVTDRSERAPCGLAELSMYSHCEPTCRVNGDCKPGSSCAPARDGSKLCTALSEGAACSPTASNDNAEPRCANTRDGLVCVRSDADGGATTYRCEGACGGGGSVCDCGDGGDDRVCVEASRTCVQGCNAPATSCSAIRCGVGMKCDGERCVRE